MGVNNMEFAQCAAILKSIADQATGTATLTATSTADFISIANTALQGGLDPVMNAITQVLARTIMSIRPYTAKLRGMEFSEREFGAVTRKLSMGDDDPSDNQALKWPVAYDAGQTPPSGDGQSVDQWIIKKPKILQTNFYGFDTWQDYLTITQEQLYVAFRGPDELAEFVGMLMTGYENKHEQYLEAFKRMCLANFAAALIDENNSDRIVHLISEYNTLTGITPALDSQTVYQPANFKPFMQFVYSRIAQITSLMTERSSLYQTAITGYNVNRHTPYEDQRVYLYAPARYQAEMMAIADIYHDNYLKLADTETLNFWQAIDTPDTINMTPTYVDTSGAVTVAGSAVSQSGVFGVIADREAFGVCELRKDVMQTPMNARGHYSNIWWSSILRAFNDNTEKGVVLLLD